MALSGALAKQETPPERLSVSATVTFVPGTGITTSVIDVVGVVPGIDEATSQKAAEGAKEGCPVSKALQGNVQLSVAARLAAS
jgi:osmotically inducible protein OsmC